MNVFSAAFQTADGIVIYALPAILAELLVPLVEPPLDPPLHLGVLLPGLLKGLGAEALLALLGVPVGVALVPVELRDRFGFPATCALSLRISRLLNSHHNLLL